MYQTHGGVFLRLRNFGGIKLMSRHAKISSACGCLLRRLTNLKLPDRGTLNVAVSDGCDDRRVLRFRFLAFTCVFVAIGVVRNRPRCLVQLLILYLNRMGNSGLLFLDWCNLFFSYDGGGSIVAMLAIKLHLRLVEWILSARQLTASSNLVLVGGSLGDRTPL